MARVVPSQVVELIDRLFPFAATQEDTQSKRVTLSVSEANRVAAILSMVDQIPAQLIALEGDNYSIYASSLAAIRTCITSWQFRGDVQPLERLPGIGSGNLNPVTLLRRVLTLCPDEYPSASTAELMFISDPEFMGILRTDLSSTNQALINGEWKAATVLAGSIVEALLLWALQKRTTTEIKDAIITLKSRSVLIKHSASKLEDWELYSLIEVSEELKIITPDTAKQARLAKDFRNLIHPGRNIRLGQICNRATALSAVAAVEHVIEDLK
jgi:hypothetical protein